MAELSAVQLPSPEACVICLSRLSEKAVALPCKHDQFDFGCLCTWLHQQRVCPLCKASITAVNYDLAKPEGATTLTLSPLKPEPAAEEGRYQRAHPYQTRYDSRGRPFSSNAFPTPRARVQRGFRLNTEAMLLDEAILFRRHVYCNQMYSLRVGSNRISRYQNLTPESFKFNELLVSRAKRWIRRELSAFAFLDPKSNSYGHTDRRASNAEFLLEYVVSILKSIDLRGSGGQAEELLTDFLGMANARLFIHELEAYLRSPYETAEVWDTHVQYAQVQDERGHRRGNTRCDSAVEDTTGAAVS